MEEKRTLRNEMIKIRADMDTGSKQTMDRLLSQSLTDLIQERQPGVVHTYLPMSEEINFNPVIEKMLELGIRVAAPKTLKGGRLENLLLSSLQELEDGVFGTRHPAGNKLYTGPYDIIIVPGLAFDHYGNRLGYGGGYYDRFLPTHPEAYKVALCYDFQLINGLPLEPHDIQLDAILFASLFESSNISTQS